MEAHFYSLLWTTSPFDLSIPPSLTASATILAPSSDPSDPTATSPRLSPEVSHSPSPEVSCSSVAAVPSYPDHITCLICGNREYGLMIQCDDCEDWVHSQCANLGIREANILPSFSCRSCSLQSIGPFLTSLPPSRPLLPKSDAKLHPSIPPIYSKLHDPSSPSATR